MHSNIDLHLGDCLEIIHTLNDGSVDVVVTDPPYGIDYKSNRQGVDRKSSISTRRDNVVRDAYFEQIDGDSDLPTEWLKTVYPKLKDGGALYIFSHWRTWHKLYPAVEEAGYKVKGMIVLRKSNHGMGDLKGSYAPKHELLLFAAKGRHLLEFPDGRKPDVWDVPVIFSGRKRWHPNEKPKGWILTPIENSTLPGHTILDPFMGSGTTGVVCIETVRSFVGIEIDPAYFSLAQNRIEEARAERAEYDAQARMFDS